MGLPPWKGQRRMPLGIAYLVLVGLWQLPLRQIDAPGRQCQFLEQFSVVLRQRGHDDL